MQQSRMPHPSGSDGAGRSRRRRFHRPRPAEEELGKWIWTSEQGAHRNCYVHARKLFSLPSNPASAVIRATAESKYKLYVNGRYAGKGPARPGLNCTYYDTHDISGLLSRGDNVVAFLVHSFGEATYHGAPRKPGLNCRIDIETGILRSAQNDAGGTRIAIVTDETWKVLRARAWTDQGERINDSLGFQEVYDAGARLDQWNEVKFDERGWENAVVVGTPPQSPWGRLVPRAIPMPREEPILPQAVVGTFNSPPRSRETQPGAVAELMASSALAPLRSDSVKNPASLASQDGVTHVRTPRGDAGVVVILDFGREVFGNLEIGIAGSGNGCIDLGYAEALRDGRVKPDREGMRYTDRILLRNGRLEWQSFEPRAFRYLQMEFRWLTRPVEIQYVRVNQTTYPATQTGSFECSDAMLNRIWETAAYTTRLCMDDVFVSTPWRERRLSWPEARIASRAAYYAFGDTALLAQDLRRFGEWERNDGSIPSAELVEGPTGDGRLVSDIPLLWVLSILDYYAFSDDVEMVRELYPKARRLMGWFAQFAGPDGLLSDVLGELFIDHANPHPSASSGCGPSTSSGCGEVTALNCLYYHALRVTGALASILGYRNDAERYEQTWSPLRLAINKHLYSPKRGLYADCRAEGKLVEKFSRQTNVFAALYDVADQYQRSTICRQLLEKALPEITTPYLNSYLLEALYAGEMYDEALDVIRRKWGAMIEAGATTFWEHFAEEGALCHAGAVSPARDLVAEYVGIKPALGAHRFSVAPHTGGLDWARGSVETKFGPLAVEWGSEGNHLLIRVDVPQGVKVDVYPPGPPDARVLVDGKAHPGRFVTIDGGTHQIKVSEPAPGRLPKIDKALQPEPVPHVEILGEALPRGLRRLRIGVGRERGERRSVGRRREPREERAVSPEAEEPTVPPPRPPPVEPVNAPEREAPTREPRKRSRRGGRRRSGAKGPAVPEASPEIAPPETRQPGPEPEAEKPPAAAKRGRRGGRHRHPRAPSEPAGAAGAETAPTAPPEPPRETAPPPPPSDAAPRGPEEPRPGSASRRFGSRRRPRKRPDHGERSV